MISSAYIEIKETAQLMGLSSVLANLEAGVPRGHPVMSLEVLIDAARIAPVAVPKYDKPLVVVIAVEQYERLTEVKNHEKPSKSAKATGR